MKSSQNSVSLYVHWPYCLSKCPYCDFASCPCSDIDEERLWQGYARDLERFLGKRPIATIFFGGGTPSLMSPKLLEKILIAVTGKTALTSDCEITMEANPDAIDYDKMKCFHGLGVNRLSFGVQALTDSALHFLGRRHTVQTALKRLDEAMRIFNRVNMDLIYARPEQTVSDWKRELHQAISLGLSHYSLYQLTIEPNTVFGKRGIRPVDEKTAAELYRVTDKIMTEAGIPAYEVSNYARPGQECHHNLVYWRGGDYLGIGPAAHGRIGFFATQNPLDVGTWLVRGTQVDTLTPEQKKMERLLMGLRLRQEWFPTDGLPTDKIDRFVCEGFLERSVYGIRPTLSGVLILDYLIETLCAD